MYHSVTDENNRDWIDPSVSIPSTIFQQHVNFLRKHRNVVRLSDLVDMIEAGHTPPARTVVVTGVSVNVGILGTALEAVNRGYTVVVPTDCVAGDPPEYAEQALRYSVRNVAFLSTREEIEAAWGV